jgi:hypothetical protein
MKLLYIKESLCGQKKLGMEQRKYRVFFVSIFFKVCNRVGTKTQKQKKIKISVKFGLHMLFDILLNKCPSIVTKFMLYGFIAGGKS